MEQEIYTFNLRNTVESFKSVPKVFRLLWDVRKGHLMLITICYIIRGVFPAISILATQSLLNAIQSSQGKEFICIISIIYIYIFEFFRIYNITIKYIFTKYL